MKEGLIFGCKYIGEYTWDHTLVAYRRNTISYVISLQECITKSEF